MVQPAPTPAPVAQPTPAPAPATVTRPRVFLGSPEALALHKARFEAGERSPALVKLLEDARRALAVPPFSITEKTVAPPSGDKRDYLSLAPYAWPDPRKADGLPYVMRDGQTNPERDTIPDHKYVGRIVELSETLGLAYYFTGDEAYAAHAARLLRAFFLDEATGMRPNLDFAQGVRGKEPGRPSGLIDTAPLARLVDGVALLAGSRSLAEADRQGLTAWFRDYLTWLQQSDLGRREGQAKNNHGSWYDVQVVALALATGQNDLAQEVLHFAHKRRIGRQIEPDGRQPEELARTRSWHYSLYALQALVDLADLGDAAGVDLWRYQTPDGRSLAKAIDYLVPFALGEKAWPTPEIGGFRPGDLWPILRVAAARLSDARLAAAAARLSPPPDARLLLIVD